MKLQKGNWYVRRDGVQTQIIADRASSLFPFQDDFKNTYRADGSFAIGQTTALDIVAEAKKEERSSLVQPAPTARGPNKHSEVIKAWADGAVVEYKGPEMTEWKELLPAGQSMVLWRDEVEYRVKKLPEEFHIVLYHQHDWDDSKKYRLTQPVSLAAAEGILRGDTSHMMISLKINVDTLEVEEMRVRKK
jgi:hypothetical protein